MERTRATNGMVRIAASDGHLMLDMRSNRRYSEIVVEEKQVKFFIEVGD